MSNIVFSQKRSAHTPKTPKSGYTHSVTPVKRDRDWSPVESAATQAAVSAMECGFVVRAPFMVARQAGASLAGSRKRVPGRPTCRATALIGLRAVVYANRTCLEAAMATSSLSAAHSCASSTTDAPNAIKLHMQAMNSLANCRALITANEPCYLFALNQLAAAQKAIEALSTIDLTGLEG